VTQSPPLASSAPSPGMPTHPVLQACEVMEQALGSVAQVNPTFMRTCAKSEALTRVARLEAQLAELRLRILAEAGDLAAETASRDAGVWFAHETRTGHPAAKADLDLAGDLERRWTAVAAGMRTGQVNLDQARVIARALSGLAPHVDGAVLAEAETHLVERAAEFGPRQLAALGSRILQVVAPDLADAIEARRLAELERTARRRTKLTLRRLGDGSTRLAGILPDAVATRLAVYLEAHTNPRKKTPLGDPAAPDGVTGEDLEQALTDAVANTGLLPNAEDPVERVSYPHRLGQAFCAFLEALDPRRLPLHGGDATLVQVAIDYEDLKADLATADVLTAAAIAGPDPDGTSDRLTAAEVRRLACNAQLLPVVLGGESEILDQGRTRRLFTAAQRRALLRRDRRCRAEGCDIPGTWAEAHHWIPWEHLGGTDLADGVLLCSHHHHRAHDDQYEPERLPNGDVRFHRRR
jgi:hypothetical protein